MSILHTIAPPTYRQTGIDHLHRFAERAKQRHQFIDDIFERSKFVVSTNDARANKCQGRINQSATPIQSRVRSCDNLTATLPFRNPG